MIEQCSVPALIFVHEQLISWEVDFKGELTWWEVDLLGVDLVGVDFVRVDLVGGHPFNQAIHSTAVIRCVGRH